MSNPLVHAERSAQKWGGVPADYLAPHQWFDATKGHMPDNRHRLILHNSFGILLAEQVFGPVITTSEGRRVFVRDLGVQHVVEDLGFVPTLTECLAGTPLAPWMAGIRRSIPSPSGDNAHERPLCAAGGPGSASETG
jgi:hypothetical protein